jgi:NAD+-dependent protein deacetylase sirtuin 6
MASADGYSARLSEYAEKGRLNLRDAPDPPRAALGKARALARMIAAARHVVLHTGAGLSTAAGIPDFRGPAGVWTLERLDNGNNAKPAAGSDARSASTTTGAVTQKQASQPPLHPQTEPPSRVSFDHAAPTLAHMAIVALYRAGYVKHVVSQNVDGLHLRSGLPRAALSELHGNLFVEMCSACEMEYVREFQIESVGFKPTGRFCDVCGGPLTDKALDWEDALPEPDFANAIMHSRLADLSVVVGSSCQMNPARNLPFRGGKGARVALVNLSKTQQDDRFAVTIRAKCDHVFAVILDELGLSIPPYERYAKILLRVDWKSDMQAPSAEDHDLRCIILSEANGSETDAIPWLSQVAFELVDSLKSIGLPGNTETSKNNVGTRATSTSVPFTATLKFASFHGPIFDRESCRVRASLVFGRGADARHEIMECRVSEGASRTSVMVATLDFREDSRKLCAALCSDSYNTRGKRCADLAAWYSRSAKRRGYVICAGCDEEVYGSKKREHMTHCVVLRRSENGALDVTVREGLVSNDSSSSPSCKETKLKQ